MDNITSNGGSITCEQMQKIVELLNEYSSVNILEYGAGVSTRLFEKYCKETNANLTTLEHDKKYHYDNNVYFNLKTCGTVNIGGNIYRNSCVYDGLEDWMNNQSKKFDFVFVDGPFGYFPHTYSRIQMLDPVVYDCLADNGVLLIHDSERKSSRNSQKELERIFNEKGYVITVEDCLMRKPQNDKLLTIIRFKRL